jgi:hypothetical protein
VARKWQQIASHCTSLRYRVARLMALADVLRRSEPLAFGPIFARTRPAWPLPASSTLTPYAARKRTPFSTLGHSPASASASEHAKWTALHQACTPVPTSIERRRFLPIAVLLSISPNVQFLAGRLRLSRDAVFSPRPSYGASQNQGRRTFPQPLRLVVDVARRSKKPFLRIPGRN